MLQKIWVTQALSASFTHLRGGDGALGVADEALMAKLSLKRPGEDPPVFAGAEGPSWAVLGSCSLELCLESPGCPRAHPQQMLSSRDPQPHEVGELLSLIVVLLVICFSLVQSGVL